MSSSVYFSKATAFQMVLVAITFVAVDLSLYFFVAENFVSKAFYAKFLICVLYLIKSKDKSGVSSNEVDVESVFHFSSYIFCLWFGVANLILVEGQPSRYVGIFLLFGAFAGFSWTTEFLQFNKEKYVQKSLSTVIFEIILKILLIVTILSAIIFLILGQWNWFIKPFYEW